MVIVQEDKSKSEEATVGGERRERRVSLGRLRGLYRRFADYVEMDGRGNRVCDLSTLAATLAGAESMDVGVKLQGCGRKKYSESEKRGGCGPLPPPNPSAFPTACPGIGGGEWLSSRRTHSHPRCSIVSPPVPVSG